MNRNLMVGIFAIGALTLFTAGLFMVGNRHEAFAKHFVVYSDFTNLSGVAKGTKVQVAGMDAGEIEEIGVPSSPKARFHLRIRLDEKLHGLVRTDSIATIGTEGVVGDAFLSIGVGSTYALPVAVGGTLRSKEPTALSDLLDQAKGTIGDADLAIRNVTDLLTFVGGSLNGTLAVARNTISDVDSVVAGVKRGNGTVGMLLEDPHLADSLRQTLSSAQDASNTLRDASAQADQLITDVHARNFPQKIDDTLVSVRETASRLNGTSVDVQKIVADAAAPDEFGQTAGVNLRQTITNMNTATGNFSEDTEALKRNFLVRAFFRHRGYYSLDGMSPEHYRRDPTFTRPTSVRVWFDQAGLFVRNERGEEELTPAGKSTFEQLLTNYGDDLQGTPIMVEGYEGQGSQKSSLSKEKALLVRQYLLAKFSLESSHIGAIGLGDQTPRGVAHDTRNGVCLVLLKQAR